MAFWFGGLLVWPSGLVAFWFGVLVESGLLVLVAFWLKVVFWFGAFWFGGLLIEGGLLVESGLLFWPSGVIFCYGLLVRPSGTGVSTNSRHPPPPPHMANEWLVRILLECILVITGSC